MVKVYAVRLIDDQRFLELRNVIHTYLPKEVCDAASKFKFPAGIQRKVVGELLLRGLLCRNHNLKHPEFKIGYTEKQKPVLTSHPHIHFNISHSGEWVVIAFSEREVGVDVEKLRKINLNVARRFFSEKEKAILFSLPEKKQLEYFFDLWTLKESFLKALGTGLTRPLKTFTVQPAEEGFELDNQDNTPHAFLQKLDIDRNYRLSVCSFGDEIDKNITVYYINDLLGMLEA